MRLLPFVILLAVAGCTADPLTSSLDRSTHVGRVLEDVTAMLEGMAEAHTEKPLVLRDPSGIPDWSRARN